MLRGQISFGTLNVYDTELKPFGFCIDGFSRKMIRLCAYHNNSSSKIIGGYYISAIERDGGGPKLVRGDLGTENGYVKESQWFRRETDVRDSLQIMLKITSKVRVSSGFRMFIFRGSGDDGLYSGDFLYTNSLQFCFTSRDSGNYVCGRHLSGANAYSITVS